MSKSRSNLHLSLLGFLVLLIPLVLGLYYFQDLLQENTELPEERLVYDLEEEEEPVEIAAAEPEAPEPRELAVRGRACLPGGDPLPSLKLTVGDQSVVSEADGSFVLPPARRGRSLKLVIELGGEIITQFDNVLVGDDPEVTPGAALQLLAPRPSQIEWTIQLPRDGARGKETKSAKKEISIELGAVLVEDWGGGGRVSVKGNTSLPPGAGIYTHLVFDGFRVASCLDPAVVTEAGNWEGTVFLAPRQRWYSGRHELSASFNAVVEDPGLIVELEKELGEGLLQKLGEVSSNCGVFIGEPAVAEKEDQEVQAYTIRMVREARRYRDGLRSRVDEVLRLGKGWNPQLLSSRNEERPGWFHELLVGKDGGFAEAHWRAYLDDSWRPGLSALLEEHRGKSEDSGSAVKKYQECYNRVEGLLGGILQMGRVYSMFVVYPVFGLKPHEKDFYFDERGREDLSVLKRIVDEHFERLERFMSLVQR